MIRANVKSARGQGTADGQADGPLERRAGCVACRGPIPRSRVGRGRCVGMDDDTGLCAVYRVVRRFLRLRSVRPGLTGRSSRHYADPALLNLLRTSLAPYANGLDLTNLVHIPVLAVHGGDDDNVPPRHSRAYVATLASYAGSEDCVRLLEVEKKGHWWADVLKQREVVEWIERLPGKESAVAQLERGFELMCVNPDECGGRAGVRVLEVDVPGR